MKNFGRLFLAVLLVGVALSFVACGKEKETVGASDTVHATAAELVGTWKGIAGEPSTLTLGEDGSYRDIADFASIIGTYTVDETEGTITVNESEYGMMFVYTYELTGDQLTIQTSGGLPRTFAKPQALALPGSN